MLRNEQCKRRTCRNTVHRLIIVVPPVIYPAGTKTDAGWSSQVAREAHNLEVAGSNPVPAIFYNFTPKRNLRYLPTFGSAAQRVPEKR